jgi:hypothetical protein
MKKMNQNSNSKTNKDSNPFNNKITIKKEKTYSSSIKMKLGSEKIEKEKSEKKEDKKDISDLYLLLQKGFEKLSTDINGLSTNINASINGLSTNINASINGLSNSIIKLSNDIESRDTQIGLILKGINNNIKKIMSSNKISFTNESQESLEKNINNLERGFRLIENKAFNNNVIECKPTNNDNENDFNININRAKSSYKNEINLNNFNLINQSKSINNEPKKNSCIKNPFKRNKIRMLKINKNFSQSNSWKFF